MVWLNAAVSKTITTGQRRHTIDSKPLLSPIKFSSDLDFRATGLNFELLPSSHVCNDRSQDVYDDATSFHSSDWDLAAPSRRLSYGEPLDSMEARSSGGPISETRIQVGGEGLAEDHCCDSWIDDTLRAQANRPYHSEPTRRKNRLWLDLVDYESEVTEAVSIHRSIRI